MGDCKIIENYLNQQKNELMKPDNWRPIILTRLWAVQAPNEAGVYVLKEGDNLIYVGETGNLRGRMDDLLDSRNHCIRRTLGERLYSDHIDFQKATASLKFPPEIETLLNTHISDNLSIAYLAVPLGRKELEELINRELDVRFRHNKRGKRKSNGKLKMNFT
jgi:hypothetical protein